jgi:uncharacterized protein YfaQ (DUF2300 family)
MPTALRLVTGQFADGMSVVENKKTESLSELDCQSVPQRVGNPDIDSAPDLSAVRWLVIRAFILRE